MSDERLWETFEQPDHAKDARVARARELKAQLAESAMRDEIRRALALLDDMYLDEFERASKVREILSGALTAGQRV
jgi:hypothetical protein